MKKIISIIILLISYSQAFSQGESLNTKTRKVGWFVTAEYSTMFLDDHVGNAVGFSAGVSLFNNHLKVGYFNYGRSGPINATTFNTELPAEVTYKGRSSVDVRADHGAFGLMIAPTFNLPNSRLQIDIPIYIGSFGAGFYLTGEDRITPDNRRVSEWEGELFEEEDANFGGLTEIGIRLLIPSKLNRLKYGVGIHYTATQGWTTYADPSGDFYNNKLRASFFIQFGSADHKK